MSQKTILKRLSGTSIIIFTLLSLANPVFAQRVSHNGHPMGPRMMSEMGWVGSFIMITFGVLLLVALILFIKWLLMQNQSNASSSPNSHQQKSSALEILKERYARGEIDKNEFEEKKKDII